jgi:hypothetical protein
LNVLPVWPMYFGGKSIHFIWQMALLLCLSANRVLICSVLSFVWEILFLFVVVVSSSSSSTFCCCFVLFLVFCIIIVLACYRLLAFEKHINKKCNSIVLLLTLFFFFGLWDYRHCGHSWPIVPASGDNEDDCGEQDWM